MVKFNSGPGSCGGIFCRQKIQRGVTRNASSTCKEKMIVQGTNQAVKVMLILTSPACQCNAKGYQTVKKTDPIFEHRKFPLRQMYA